MSCRMEEFFALGKDDAPENIPMMFITMPSVKDPEAKIRHPGMNPLVFLPVRLLLLLSVYCNVYRSMYVKMVCQTTRQCTL